MTYQPHQSEDTTLKTARTTVHECSQGKDCEMCRRATVACLLGLLSWLSAPLRWMRRWVK